jgi:putative spermidine/putrescine transport system substrate-binding protein
LLNPEFKNAVGLDNSPTASGAGQGAVIAASVDNGGSVSNVQPGINFWPMADKAVLATVDWSFNQSAWKAELAKSPGIDWKIIVPSGKPYAAYYAMAISAYAPHPAAARLWEEYNYGVTGANIRALSGALPSTWVAMIKNHTASMAAEAAIPSFSQSPAVATPAQDKADVAVIQKEWQSAVG